MELVTMPLSQRTRSSPVTRIQPVSSRGEIAGCCGGGRRAEAAGLAVSGWAVGAMVGGNVKLCVHLIIAVD